MRSSVPAFKAALEARLKADSDLIGDDLTVSWGDPSPKPATRELVAIGNTSNRAVEYRGVMTQGRETYDVVVIVSVIGSDKVSHADLVTRAYDLAQAVTENVLAWRETAFDGVCDIVTENPGEDDENVGDGGRESSVTLSFRVTASI